jgi:hypothetical protein
MQAETRRFFSMFRLWQTKELTSETDLASGRRPEPASSYGIGFCGMFEGEAAIFSDYRGIAHAPSHPYDRVADIRAALIRTRSDSSKHLLLEAILRGSRIMPKDLAKGVLYVAPSPSKRPSTPKTSPLRPDFKLTAPRSPRSILRSLLFLLPLFTVLPYYCKELHYDLPKPVTNG